MKWWWVVMQVLQLLCQHRVAAVDPQIHNIHRANLLHQVYRETMYWVHHSLLRGLWAL
jgi:hypothetical protein